MNKRITSLTSVLTNIAMVILAFYSFYIFWTTIGVGLFIQLLYIFTQPFAAAPALALLSMFVFAVLYLYASYRHASIHKLARAIAYVFTALMLVAFILLVTGIIQDLAGVHCTGFFGVETSCFEYQYITMFILLLLHPFVHLAYLALALCGIVMLFKTLRGKKQ